MAFDWGGKGYIYQTIDAKSRLRRVFFSVVVISVSRCTPETVMQRDLSLGHNLSLE